MRVSTLLRQKGYVNTCYVKSADADSVWLMETVLENFSENLDHVVIATDPGTSSEQLFVVCFIWGAHPNFFLAFS